MQSITVRDTVFDPKCDDRVVYFREIEGRKLYKVWIYLEGAELPYINSATYVLHPTFPQPVRRVPRSVSNPNCELVIWTWGVFGLNVTVEDKVGRTYQLQHYMSYDQQLQKPGFRLTRER
jgi:transcription initiation factor IIF auxiliary subunit